MRDLSPRSRTLPELLHDRYELGETLSSAGATRLATDRETGERCVVKELTLGRVSDWKQIDLFEREANALGQLSHAGVPRLIDSFQTDGAHPNFYIVQSFTDGESLARVVEVGGLAEDDVIAAAKGVLAILEYLQGFSPPVLHRDITPYSIIRRPDGAFALVDFGSVQVELRGTMGGSTIVGTSGYMAPEQLMGRAVPASDVYALGMTLIELMTGFSPSELPMDRMKPRWRHHAPGHSERLLDIVDRMVEPNREKRFEDASATLRAFGSKNGAVVRGNDTLLATRPSETDIGVERTAKKLVVTVPHRRASGARLIGVLLTATLTATALAIIVIQLDVSPVLLAVAVVAWFLLVANGRPRARPEARLELDVDRGFRIRSADTGGRLRAGPFSNIVGVAAGTGRQQRSLFVATTEELFEIQRLRDAERDWLTDEIEDFVARQRGLQ